MKTKLLIKLILLH